MNALGAIIILAIFGSLFFEGWNDTEHDVSENSKKSFSEKFIDRIVNFFKWFFVLLAIFIIFSIVKTLWKIA